MTERICLTLFLFWIVWLPLPYGSNIDSALPPLIAIPLILCVSAALLRLKGRPWRAPGRAWWIWTIGALLFLLVGVLQLVPLTPSLLRAVAPASSDIWRSADQIAWAGHGGTIPVARTHCISVNPGVTFAELLRLIALFATFQTAALLVDSRARRSAFVVAIVTGGLFESIYAVRQAALQNYDIWGWHNALIFHRATGTFVNPNHFADYLAITLPFAILLLARAWHESSPAAPLARRLARLIERHVLLAGAGLLAATAFIAAMLLAQSRGALFALGGALLVIGLMLTIVDRQKTSGRGRRLTLVALAALLAVVFLMLYLGRDRTIARFKPLPSENATLVGRRVGITAAFHLWKLAPNFGFGLGTFADVVSMTQEQDSSKLYHHAHDDYAEVAATAGTLGFVIAIVTLLGGYVALVRSSFGHQAAEASWNRRAFQIAALASLTVAMIHSLLDFNFFIPANAATMAAICGVAVSLRAGFRQTRSMTTASRQEE